MNSTPQDCPSATRCETRLPTAVCEAEPVRGPSDSEGERRGSDAVTPQVPSRSQLQSSGRFLLFLVLMLFGGIMGLGVGVALLETLSSYFDADGRLGEFLFTALFEGFLGWGSVWLAWRVRPWASPGQPAQSRARSVLKAGGVLLMAASLLMVLSGLVWMFYPLRNQDVPPATDLTGVWSLDLNDSSPDFGSAKIESGILEFQATGSARRTLRLNQSGRVTEYVSALDNWKLIGASTLRFSLPDRGGRYELAVFVTDDQLSFADWETFGVETWRRDRTKPTE